MEHLCTAGGNVKGAVIMETIGWFLKKLKLEWGPVAHVCNPSYLGG
jgi:hypothetical protein